MLNNPHAFTFCKLKLRKERENRSKWTMKTVGLQGGSETMVYDAIVNVNIFEKKEKKNENKFALANHHNMLMSLVLFDAFATHRRKCN